MSVRAWCSFGYERGGVRFEWWWVVQDGGRRRFVRIEVDAAWFHRSGSINDLRDLAVAAAAL